ncbi:alpha/beta fold hydrolase [Oscillatoria sp. CS-180]|uniref:alpha/beta fold hydrolase n=1 Tax=Oscillatoria sp. CS-180 TaxID=3021720 RepID=UPI00232B12A1|nr:alpha/beta hydrolase [Oscillatoria sp. CS-180]
MDNSSLISQGTGDPTLVFLHYFSGAAASWQWVTQELKEDFRCISLDLPGFGDTPPLAEPTLAEYSNYIWELLSRLGIDRFVLVGHSMGGKIALKVAADALFAGLEHIILVAPSPATREPMPEEERDRMLADHHSRQAAETTVEGAAQATLPQIRHSVAVQTHTKAEDKTWQWWLLEGMKNSIADQVKKIQVPVTVLASPDDPVIPFNVIQRDVIDLLPNSKLVTIPNVGHLMPLEAPDLVAQAIRQAIARQGQGV